jgi:hypothetical protein
MKVKNIQNPLLAMILNLIMLEKRKTLKTIPSRSMKVKNLQNPPIAIFSKCDDVEYFSTSEEENLEIVCIESNDIYPMEELEEELSELQNNVEWGLYEYKSNHYFIDYSYLSDNNTTFLKRSQSHILKLKEMLKE